jgi:hypothetical protein
MIISESNAAWSGLWPDRSSTMFWLSCSYCLGKCGLMSKVSWQTYSITLYIAERVIVMSSTETQVAKHSSVRAERLFEIDRSGHPTMLLTRPCWVPDSRMMGLMRDTMVLALRNQSRNIIFVFMIRAKRVSVAELRDPRLRHFRQDRFHQSSRLWSGCCRLTSRLDQEHVSKSLVTDDTRIGFELFAMVYYLPWHVSRPWQWWQRRRVEEYSQPIYHDMKLTMAH